MDQPEPPLGAIENGREHLRRLRDFYTFYSDDHPLHNCRDFIDAQACFEAMAEYIGVMGARNAEGQP